LKNKLGAILILTSIVAISILIVVLPTFFTKGISRVSLNKEITLPLILNDEKDIKILFFGYSGCSDVCTPRLNSLAAFYSGLDESTQKRVGVEFIDISMPFDKTLPQRFAEYFNKEFKGIYLDKKVLYTYTRVFEIYFSKSLLDEMKYDHTSNIYLLKKSSNKKELRFIYSSFPYDFKQINRDIQELIDE